MNDVKLMGRIGWMRYSLTENTSICNFRMAVKSKWSSKKDPNWINCVSFGKTAEIINEHYKVGKQVCISDAELSTSKWIQDGVEVERLEVVVHRVEQIYAEKTEESELLEKSEKGFVDEDLSI
jgi:single-strand DNA-binding protein